MQHDNNSSQGPLDQIYAHDPTTKNIITEVKIQRNSSSAMKMLISNKSVYRTKQCLS